jgi:hypothetical protein
MAKRRFWIPVKDWRGNYLYQTKEGVELLEEMLERLFINYDMESILRWLAKRMDQQVQDLRENLLEPVRGGETREDYEEDQESYRENLEQSEAIRDAITAAADLIVKANLPVTREMVAEMDARYAQLTHA